MIDFVQDSLIAIDHISAALHRYRVKTAGVQGSGQGGGGGALSVGIENAVCFHCADQVAALFPACIKDAWIRVPTVHKDTSAHIIRERSDDVQGHIDFCAVLLRAATFQGIEQRRIPGSNDGGVDLVSADHFPLQMGVMPAGTLSCFVAVRTPIITRPVYAFPFRHFSDLLIYSSLFQLVKQFDP